jgi:predicted nucleotidyltransferase
MIEEKAASVDDPTLREAVERLATLFRAERIYLFGSRARGDATPDSDYDLMVIVTDSELPAFRRAQRAYRALQGLGMAKDVLVWTRQEFDRRKHLPASFAATILREGRLLHVA